MIRLPARPNEQNASTIQILIVEDERAVARDLKETLEHLGYGVPAIASSGSEAIAQVEALRPNLVLMDIVLEDGDRDGIETAQEIRDRFGIPVIYLTAYATLSIVERAKATDPFGYLLKPYRQNDLWVAIETALKRYSLEQSLHEREEWLNRILNGMGDGVIVFDTAQRIRFMNPVAENLTGVTQTDALEQPLQNVFDIVQEETRSPLLPSLLQTVAQGEVFYLPLNTLLAASSGQEVPIFDSAAPLRDSNSEISGGIIVFRDAHTVRLANERNLAVARSQQLEQQMQDIENLNRLKDDFLSTVSHELRTPLSNIKMATRMLTVVLDQLDLLTQTTEATTTPLAQYIQILQQETEKELALINDLLDLQRIQAEGYALELSLTQLQNRIPHLAEPFQLKADENQQVLQVAIPSDLPALWTDPYILDRIVSELLNNACKYTPPAGQIIVTAQLQPDSNSPLDSSIVLEICNSGVTLSPEEQERIFEAFYRIPGNDRWSRGGTGLGLALVKKFTNLLGGRVEVSSTLEYLCFHVFLPFRDWQDPSQEP